jgi:hemerythrin
MPALVWSDALKLDNPRMDATHLEFVELLNLVKAATGDEVLSRYRRLIEHTEEHFGQEDRWMRLTGFAPENCHQGQHRHVLQVLYEIERQLLEHQPVNLPRFADELGAWFSQHAQTMDAALAWHLELVGFDTETETLREAAAASLPAEPITGCGSRSCG